MAMTVRCNSCGCEVKPQPTCTQCGAALPALFSLARPDGQRREPPNIKPDPATMQKVQR
jgi:hypothetical protein